MEVTAPLFRLMVQLLLSAQLHLSSSVTAGEASLQVVPDRQQHFERDALTLSCEGLDGPTRWKVLRKVKGRVGPCGSTWESATGTCKIVNVYKVDSGEYWCERAERKSSSVNITVTGGPVILESPVAPVMEGDDVMLRCAQRTNSSNYLTASFYKNHFLLEESPTGNVTIHRVSRSHQGSYKCSIAGVGESEQSWLTVTATLEDPPSSPPLHLLLTIGVSVVLIALLLWLAVHQHKINETTRASPSSPQSCSSPGAAEQHQPPPVNTTLSSVCGVTEENQATYAVVTSFVRSPRAAERTEATYSVLSSPVNAKASETKTTQETHSGNTSMSPEFSCSSR